MTSSAPIVITPGEPAGIGPDLVIQLCQQEKLENVVVIADRDLLMRRASELGLKIDCLPSDKPVLMSGQMAVHHIDLPMVVEPGEPETANAGYILKALDIAIDGCMQNEFSAMVTGPLNKALINDAGIQFSGHTEYLAERASIPLPVMMLATDDLRVALATTHLALKDVPAAINSDLVLDVLRVIHRQFEGRLGMKAPRIGVCGLNPHAGESGYLGREELDEIIPAMEQAVEEGINAEGPLPADTAFTNHMLERFDVMLAMYHDQGLPVLKHHGFGRAANITLGLPFVRTSVDHGTAFDIAGTGKADLGGLQTALNYARALTH